VRTVALIGIAAPSLVTGTAQAEILTYQPLPPPEYDHPYDKELTIVDNVNWETIQKVCGPIYANAPSGSILTGCAHIYPDHCLIYIAEPRTMQTASLVYHSTVRDTYDRVLRHEIGHCNGWSSYHPNPQRDALPRQPDERYNKWPYRNLRYEIWPKVPE